MKHLYDQGLISVYDHPIKGFCVKVNTNIYEDTKLCVNAVSLIEFNALKKKSKFNDYPMWWDKKTDCIAFGVINLLNHNNSPTVYLKRDRRNRLITMYANKDLKIGDECTINYACKLWFKPL
jgi:hypothetical protein